MKAMPRMNDVLSNGARVIDSRKLSDNPKDEYLAVVLCGFQEQYVTWEYNRTDGACFWGHYFQDDLEKAQSDFITRD